jgi:uncharacterized membrane protein
MPQTTCPFCDGSVSDEAPVCPHCGRRLWGPRAARPAALPVTAAPLPRRDPHAERAAAAKPLAMLGYGLQILAFLYFVPTIAALIMAYIKRGEVRGTWMESHFEWQIQTFWLSLLGVLCAVVLLFVLAFTTGPEVLVLTYVVGPGVIVWYIYRIVRGALALSNDRPVG